MKRKRKKYPWRGGKPERNQDESVSQKFNMEPCVLYSKYKAKQMKTKN
jgi:hypothetical protein